MLAELSSRCSRLCPSVVPAGFADSQQHGVALLSLCAEEERGAFGERLSAARADARGRCALTGRDVPTNALRFVSRWELDPHALECRLASCSFACPEAALLLDTAGMLERFTGGKADAKELTELAQLFCETNRAPERVTGGGPAAARLWLQECLSLAHACQVVASGCGAWRAVLPDAARVGVGPSEPGYAAALAEAMLGGGGGARGTPGSKGKGKRARAADSNGSASTPAAEAGESAAPMSAKKSSAKKSSGKKKRRGGAE